MNQTYRQFLDAGLGVDSSVALNDIVDDNLMGFGSTIDEKIFNVSELKELIARQKEQSKDIDLRWEVKPLSHYTSVDENTAFFADELFLYANVGGEWLEMYLRFSVVLSYVNNKWKVIHWHGSKPENVKSEEDTFGIETWKQKAETLEKLVEERTAELVEKNRDLEIETSLERVRAVAMGMHKPDDLLNICQVYFNELKALGFTDIRNALIHIFNDEKGYYYDYDYSDFTGGKITHLPYKGNPTMEKFLEQIRKSDDAFVEVVFDGKELAKWKEFRKKSGQIDDKRIEVATQLNYYFYSFGAGNIGFSNFRPVDSGKLAILKRFRNVFDFSYRRYLDIEKAEAQTRESQIQLALERVRARTMAMQRSDELMETAAMLFDQLRQLGEDIERTIIGVMNEEERMVDFWATRPDGSQMEKMQKFPIDEPIVMQKVYNAWRQQKKSIVIDLRGAALENYFQFLKARGPRLKRESFGERRVENFVFFSKGMFGIISADPTKPANVELYERFAAVFDQTYTRFLDLQKAESQAREAKIEAALERVRAVAMAMHRSDELITVSEVMYNELISLGFSNIRNAQIAIENEEKQSFVTYVHSEYEHSVLIGPYSSSSLLLKAKQQLSESGAFYQAEYTGKELEDWRAWRKTRGAEAHDPRELSATSLRWYLYAIGKGHMGISTFDALTDEQVEIAKRFKNVFELSYRRFDDLQKAEAQSKEAKIEAALERVRSRSLAMQKSDELKEVIQVVYDQFVHLNVNTKHTGFVMDYMQRDDRLIWVASEYGVPSQLTIPYFDSEYYNRFNEAKEKGWDFFATNLGFEEKNIFYRELFKYIPDLSDDAKDFYFNCPGLAISTVLLEDVGLYIENFEGIPYSDEDNAMLMRFGKVFQQTYTRFLDLQKAEAQAREANIEAALERTRTQSMLMQQSNELDITSRVFHEQLLLLGIDSEFSYVWLPDVDKDKHFFWATWNEEQNGSNVIQSKSAIYDLDRSEPYTAACFVAWESGEPVHIYPVPPAEVKNYFDIWSGIMGDAKKLQPEFFPEGLYYDEAFMKYGCFGIVIRRLLTEDEKKILLRFTIEFERTYTRFLDLQKAEAQAREAKIEAALEKVRSRTMGMHKSDELLEIITVVSEQLHQLNIRFDNVSFGINNEDYDINFWMAAKNQPYPLKIHVPYIYNPIVNRLKEAQKNGVEFFADTATVEENRAWITHIFNAGLKNFPEERKQYLLNSGYARSTVILKNINFFIGNYSAIPYTHEENAIIRRFANVFEQAYTRFLDLQKAEGQARQARIEAAMEKVRSRAMAMQKPQELIEVAELLRNEMGLLGVEELETSSIYIHHEDSGKTECWYAIKDVEHPDKQLVSDHMIIDLSETSVGRQMLQFYHSGKNRLSVPMKGDARKEWINYCAAHSKVLVGFYGDKIPDRTYHLFKFSNGYMGAASPGEISAESWELLQRATSVFSLAYTRFSDLQQAEAQAKEAKIEAALERVRSRTLAMQKSDELADTSAVLFKQLINLGIEPNRLYITIIKDENGEAEFWITDEDGSKISFAYTANLNDNASFKKMLDGWKEQKKSLIIDIQGEELHNYFQHLKRLTVPFKGGLSHKRRMQHLAYFGKGFIGMASSEEQSQETVDLLERFASVFNLTLTRFNDLKLAEAQALQAEQDLIEVKAARKKAEDTLTELQATQKQLIQSEKMASLGELTAGIAHEIQNPLNFVNNFSEVSNELISEMVEEVEKGNTAEVKAIAGDVKQNLEKILHHGKRADAIVKGMLQHSRSSSSVKDPTDINALADEYLRLAYHGLRAKDKSFNATLKTDFDESIGAINIIPQDIGRAILNLITNAFYVVAEKKKQNLDGYEPTVSISTKRVHDKVEIRVTDNGDGIQAKLLDKIFQPFFTTKPTGQGTGLGLSLSYDIVKAHSGELKVKTKEGEGTEFIIELPFA